MRNNKAVYFLIFIPIILICCQQYELKYESSYWDLINEAEMAIVNKDYAQSVKSYEMAFETGHYIYLKDLWNAGLVGLLKGDTTQTLDYLSTIFDKGINIGLIEKHHIYQKLLQKEELRGRVYKVYNSASKNIYDSALRAKLDTLHGLDQCLRRKDPQYQVLRDTIENIDKFTTTKLKTLIEKYGYPSESLIGRETPWPEQPHEIVIFHDLQNGNKTFLPILDSAFEKGKIHPYQYAEFYDLSKVGDAVGYYGTQVFYKKDKETIHKDYDSLRQLEINENRRRIGLESIEDYDKKVQYFLKDDSTFVFYHRRSISFEDALELQMQGIDPYSDDY